MRCSLRRILGRLLAHGLKTTFSQYSSSPEGENEKSRRRIKRSAREEGGKPAYSPARKTPDNRLSPPMALLQERSPARQYAGTSQRVPTALQGIGLTLMTQTDLRPAHGTPQLLCAPCPASPRREREREREIGELADGVHFSRVFANHPTGIPRVSRLKNSG